MIDFEKEFNESYGRLLKATTSRENEFFDVFYERFIASSPEVAAKFRDVNMEHQKTMLKQSLFHMLNLFTQKTIPDSLTEIAVKHSRRHLDIRPELYHLWLECLIETVREMDPQFNDHIELAWRMVCSQGIALMTFMYDKQTPLRP